MSALIKEPGWSDRAQRDSVLQWGMRITPLMIMHVVDTALGVRVGGDGRIMVKAQTAGMQVCHDVMRL